MDKDYTIKHMTKEELEIAIDWAAREGWNPGLHDAACFFQADPSGFFAGIRNDRVIAVGSAVIYDACFAFCGLYIVDPAFRNQGYGLALTQERLRYIGMRNAGIDGVINMLDKYERLGYLMAHKNARYSMQARAFEIIDCHHCMTLNDVDFEKLSDYDRQHFPARREDFLRCWINQSGGMALGYVMEGMLKGYAVIRPCREGYKIGPLFADTPDIADTLFQRMVHFAKDKVVYLDIPENNPNARAIVRHYQMEKIFETARMYLKGVPDIAIEQIYGITSFELG